MQYSGLRRAEADEELARLMARHDGDVEVTEEGTLLYLFPDLMVSAHGRVDERPPAPAWRRLEPKRAVTGNSTSTNTLIAGLNGFNLVAAAAAPVVIFPRLGIGGAAAEWALIWVPLAFSATFFAVPAVRAVGVARDNARRGLRNLRRVVLGLLSRGGADGGGQGDAAVLDSAEVRRRADELLKGQLGAGQPLEPVLDGFVADYDGEVEVTPSGSTRIRMPEFHAQLRDARTARERHAFEQRAVGEIVYASDDDSVASSERDLEAFDRLLQEPLQVAVRDERVIAALQDEAQNTRTEKRSSRPMRGSPHWS